MAAIANAVDLAIIRKSIRRERKLVLNYTDGEGKTTERIIWPFLIGYFENASLVSGWCELRNGIRHFRTDRIASAVQTEVRYPQGRQVLLKLWQATEKHPAC